MTEQFKQLAEMAKPILEYLEKEYDPYCKVVISANGVFVERTDVGIPVQEVYRIFE